MLLLYLLIQTPEVKIKFNPLEWDIIPKQYNVKSYVLGNSPIKIKSGDKLTPIKICDDPSIPKFTLSVARKYYGVDVFKSMDGLAAFTVPYKASSSGFTIEGTSQVIMATDRLWRRVIFGVKGDINLYSFGSSGKGPGQFFSPWDIAVSFPYVYITDPWRYRISVWKIKIDTFPNGDYHFAGFSFYKNIGEGILRLPYGVGVYENNPSLSDDDLIYVADEGMTRIVIFDKEGNLIRIFGRTKRVSGTNPPGTFSTPRDVEVDLEGNVYVIDYPNVLLAYRDTFISDKPFYWEVYEFPDFSKIKGLALDDNGRVYVGWEKHNEQGETLDCKIVRFLPQLEDVDWMYGGKGTNLGEFPGFSDLYILGSFLGVSEGWGENKGLAYFLIPDIVNDTIPPVAKFLSPPDSTYVNGNVPLVIKVEDNNHIKNYTIYFSPLSQPENLEIITFGMQEGEFLAGYWDTDTIPEGLYMLVLTAYDLANNKTEDTLLVYVGEPYSVFYFGSFGRDKGKLRLPSDVTVDKDGFIYIADTQNDRVQKFDNDGKFLLSFGKHGRGEGEFMQPNYISVKEEKLYVSDQYNHRVQVFDKEGNFIFAFGNHQIFNQPGGIDFDEDGNIYVADIHNHRICKSSSDGDFISSFGKYGEEPGKFNQPHGIFILDSLIYVADRQNNRVQIFNLKGNFVKSMGKEGSERGEFEHPYDLVVDRDTSLYVSDQHNNRLQKFDKYGNVLLTIYGDKLPDSLKQPTGVFVTQKFLYVVDMHRHKLVIFPLKIPPDVLLSRYNVAPGDILVFPNPSSGNFNFVIAVPRKEEKGKINILGSKTNHTFVELYIYDVLGRKIKTFIKGYFPSGKRLLVWKKDNKNGRKVPTGIYFLYGKIGDKKVRKKLVSLK